MAARNANKTNPFALLIVGFIIIAMGLLIYVSFTVSRLRTTANNARAAESAGSGGDIHTQPWTLDIYYNMPRSPWPPSTIPTGTPDATRPPNNELNYNEVDFAINLPHGYRVSHTEFHYPSTFSCTLTHRSGMRVYLDGAPVPGGSDWNEYNQQVASQFNLTYTTRGYHNVVIETFSSQGLLHGENYNNFNIGSLVCNPVSL